MPYLPIASRRIPYDIDGTVVGYNGSYEYSAGITAWASASVITNLNTESAAKRLTANAVWLFFPHKMEVEGFHVQNLKNIYNNSWSSLQGSKDSSNGVDGTWETAVITGAFHENMIDTIDGWRSKIGIVSFSEPKKILRMLITGVLGGDCPYSKIHVYGRKAAGETPDDILICDTSGNELTALMDWGDRPEGTTLIKSIKIKNASIDKIANNVNLQLNHEDFLMSFSQDGPWQATLDISSIPANSLSAEIFIKNTLGPPHLILGPKAARIITTVGSFT